MPTATIGTVRYRKPGRSFWIDRDDPDWTEVAGLTGLRRDHGVCSTSANSLQLTVPPCLRGSIFVRLSGRKRLVRACGREHQGQKQDQSIDAADCVWDLTNPMAGPAGSMPAGFRVTTVVVIPSARQLLVVTVSGHAYA